MSTPALLLIQNVASKTDEKHAVEDAVAALMGKPVPRRETTRAISEEVRLWAGYDNGGNVVGTVALLPFLYWEDAKDDGLHSRTIDFILNHSDPTMGFAGHVLKVMETSAGLMQVWTGRLAALMCRSELNRWEPIVTHLDASNEHGAPSWIIQIIQPEPAGSFSIDDPDVLRRLTPTIRVWDAQMPFDVEEAAVRKSDCTFVVADMNKHLPIDAPAKYRLYENGSIYGIEYEFTPIVLEIALAGHRRTIPQVR